MPLPAVRNEFPFAILLEMVLAKLWLRNNPNMATFSMINVLSESQIKRSLSRQKRIDKHAILILHTFQSLTGLVFALFLKKEMSIMTTSEEPYRKT